MNLSLAPEIQNFIESKVRAGQYASPEDVVADAIERLMLEDEQQVDAETVAAIERAQGEFDRGEDRPFEDVAAELRRKYLGKASVDAVRSMPTPPFVVYYRVNEKSRSVQILTVRHGARRKPRKFD